MAVSAPGRDRPVAREAAEVVEAEELRQAEVRPDALDPPVEAVLLEDVPAVERVPPELPRLAEVVGRDARRPAPGRPPRPARRSPGATRRRRCRARRRSGCRRGSGCPRACAAVLHAVPLPEEEELEEDVPGDLVGQLPLGARERRRLAAPQLLGPLPEGRAAVAPLQRHEEGPVGEPDAVRRRLRRIPAARPSGPPGPSVRKSPPHLPQEPLLPRRSRARSRPGAPGSPARARAPHAGRSPSATRRSGERSIGLPAKAESVP